MTKKRVAYVEAPMSSSDFFRAYAHLATTDRHILLESANGGTLSIAGIDPLATYESANGENRLTVTWADGKVEQEEGDPLELLERRLTKYTFEPIEALPAFQGGVLGYISYDYVRRYVTMEPSTRLDIDVPDLYFYLFDQWVVYDHTKQIAYFIGLSGCIDCVRALRREWEEVKERPLREVKKTSIGEVTIEPSKETFVRSVEEIQSLIAQNDVKQVNISLRQSADVTLAPLDLYRSLRSLNPSPYMGWMKTPFLDIVSGSPELLLRKRGRTITTRPIGGTAARGETEQLDARQKASLQSSQKDMTEHEMLVALECDDFRQVCEPSSVGVTASQVIETYSHVFHIVSEVEGTLREDVSLAEWVRAIFPGGSITGDPKVPTIEIIERLETVRRGLYTGSIGWIGFNGDVEWNILIRTALLHEGKMYVQAGAGITLDSDPSAEFEESLTKGRALWEASHRVKEASLK